MHPATPPYDHHRRLAEGRPRARAVRDWPGVLSSRWSVDDLRAPDDGSRRYHELLAELDPISEKVLTQTLRAMERDGLVGRRVHAEVPPRVEYALTPLGATLASPMKALAGWTLSHGTRVEHARERFDARRAAAAAEQPPQAA